MPRTTLRETRDPRMTCLVPGPHVSFGKMVRIAVEYDHVYNFYSCIVIQQNVVKTRNGL